MKNFRNLKVLVTTVILLSTLVAGQSSNSNQSATPSGGNDQAPVTSHNKAEPPAEDISGMYSFLREGEFVQINLGEDGASGYISRKGDLDSDRGAFLDQFFDKASVTGHDVSFTTKPLHGVTFEFIGRFERGAAKSKAYDGYYVLRGTLKELVTDNNGKTSSRSREVVFKLLGQPPEQSGRSKDD